MKIEHTSLSLYIYHSKECLFPLEVTNQGDMVWGMRDTWQGLICGHFLVARHGNDLFHKHLRVQKDIVQAAMEATDIVSVGWFSTSTLELKGAVELHGALLLRAAWAPVRVAFEYRSLAQELEEAWRRGAVEITKEQQWSTRVFHRDQLLQVTQGNVNLDQTHVPSCKGEKGIGVLSVPYSWSHTSLGVSLTFSCAQAYLPLGCQ